MRVKCLAKERNTMSPARTRTRTTPEASAPDHCAFPRSEEDHRKGYCCRRKKGHTEQVRKILQLAKAENSNCFVYELKQQLTMNVNKAMSRSAVKETYQFAPNSRRISNGKSCPVGASVMVNDLEQAEMEVIKLVQADAFQKEIKTLKELQADVKCESCYEENQ